MVDLRRVRPILAKKSPRNPYGVSVDDKTASSGFFSTDKVANLKSRQAYLRQSVSTLPTIANPSKSFDLSRAKGDLDELLGDIDRVDLSPLRTKLETSGRQFHIRIKRLSYQSMGAYAKQQLIREAEWKKSLGFTKAVQPTNKHNVWRL
jgi:hypothetical protein